MANPAAPLQPKPVHLRIYVVVRAIPPGRVATYGQIAGIVGSCTARMVGYAMAAAPADLPWHRVINAQGSISQRSDGGGAYEQRQRLEAEGVHFDANGKVNLRQVRWVGPSLEWRLAHGLPPEPNWRPG
jgi:methylated-DNA-protein-cysteine methyltransferase related protein